MHSLLRFLSRRVFFRAALRASHLSVRLHSILHFFPRFIVSHFPVVFGGSEAVILQRFGNPVTTPLHSEPMLVAASTLVRDLLCFRYAFAPFGFVRLCLVSFGFVS